MNLNLTLFNKKHIPWRSFYRQSYFIFVSVIPLRGNFLCGKFGLFSQVKAKRNITVQCALASRSWSLQVWIRMGICSVESPFWDRYPLTPPPKKKEWFLKESGVHWPGVHVNGSLKVSNWIYMSCQLTWTTGSMCTCMFMQLLKGGVGYGHCKRVCTEKLTVLKNIPCHTWDSNLLPWHASPTAYQLSYISAQGGGSFFFFFPKKKLVLKERWFLIRVAFCEEFHWIIMKCCTLGAPSFREDSRIFHQQQIAWWILGGAKQTCPKLNIAPRQCIEKALQKVFCWFWSTATKRLLCQVVYMYSSIMPFSVTLFGWVWIHFKRTSLIKSCVDDGLCLVTLPPTVNRMLKLTLAMTV